MSRAGPYHYIRFTWWQRHSPTKLVEMLKRDFAVTPPLLEKDNPYSLSPYKGERWEVLVKADTLSALLSAFRAVLFQRTREPFTKRDLELRKIVFSLYPRTRSTPLPWGFGTEPPFEAEEENEA